MPITAHPLRALAITLAVVASATGCAHDDGALPSLTPAEQHGADELTAHFTTAGGYTLDPPTATCVSARVVKALGTTVSHQLATGNAASLTDSQAARAAETINRCMDLRALVGQTITAGAPLAARTVDCMTNKLTTGELKTIIAAQLQGRSAATTPAYTKAATSMNSCLTDADRLLIARAPTSTSTTTSKVG